MNLKKIVKKTGDEVETLWAITPDQEQFLVNFAINHLLEKGVLSVIEEELSPEGNETMSLLENLNKDTLPRA